MKPGPDAVAQFICGDTSPPCIVPWRSLPPPRLPPSTSISSTPHAASDVEGGEGVAEGQGGAPGAARKWPKREPGVGPYRAISRFTFWPFLDHILAKSRTGIWTKPAHFRVGFGRFLVPVFVDFLTTAVASFWLTVLAVFVKRFSRFVNL
jgi:hypothetical protein